MLIINLILIKIFYMNQNEMQIKGDSFNLSQLKEEIQSRKKISMIKIMKTNVYHQGY